MKLRGGPNIRSVTIGVLSLEAAKRQEAEGVVRAITGSCGFLALFQRGQARAVDLPMFASSLIQVPSITA
jgi:hypothetical protein